MFFAINLASLLFGCFTVVTFVFYPERWKWPSMLILHLTVASMISAFSGTISALHTRTYTPPLFLWPHRVPALWNSGVTGLLCESETRWAHWPKPSLCALQGPLLIASPSHASQRCCSRSVSTACCGGGASSASIRKTLRLLAPELTPQPVRRSWCSA